MQNDDAPRGVILGEGIAGVTAAHELAERGFQVSLSERNSFLGGKAFSFVVLNDGPAERKGYPAEHCFRFFSRRLR